jgi:hypothetical protein
MEAEQQPQRQRRKGQKRKLEDEAAAAVAAAVAASSSLGSAGADDDNEDDGSAGPEICCRRSNAALVREVRTQVDDLLRCTSWHQEDRATAKRATHVLAELAKNGNIPPPDRADPCARASTEADLIVVDCTEDVVNVIVEGGAVPVLVCHLVEPAAVDAVQEQPRPFQHEVEKGAAFALGLLAVKVPDFFNLFALGCVVELLFSYQCNCLNYCCINWR